MPTNKLPLEGPNLLPLATLLKGNPELKRRLMDWMLARQQEKYRLLSVAQNWEEVVRVQGSMDELYRLAGELSLNKEDKNAD